MDKTKLDELMNVAEQYLAEAMAQNFEYEVSGMIKDSDVFNELSEEDADAFTEHLWSTLTAFVTVGSVKAYMTNPM